MPAPRIPGSHTIVRLAVLLTSMAACALGTLYVLRELEYAAVQKRHTVPVIAEPSFEGVVAKGSYTGAMVLPVFRKNFPAAPNAIRLLQWPQILRPPEKQATGNKFLFADSTLFTRFPFRLIRGNPAKALNGPHRLLITESMAKKYFGSTDPMGQVIRVGKKGSDYVVNGIIEDCPSGSRIRFDFVASFSSLIIPQAGDWSANCLHPVSARYQTRHKNTVPC